MLGDKYPKHFNAIELHSNLVRGFVVGTMRTRIARIQQDHSDESVYDIDFNSATIVLRAIANAHRFKILCLLANEERKVSELEQAVGIRQPSMSQQLARLRDDGIVSCRRDGKMMIYSLINDKVRRLVLSVGELYRL